MNKKGFFPAGALLLVGASLAGCSGGQKATAPATAVQDCNYALAGTARMNLTTERATAVSGNDLPKEYAVLKASNEKAFFAAVKKEGGMAAIQLPSGCRKFRLSLSETMSPQLAERYPDLVSLKGVSDNGTDLRLDWDGSTMRGQILEAGKQFLLEPQTGRSGNLYILFNKDDATTPRRAFETTLPAQKHSIQRNDAVDK